MVSRRRTLPDEAMALDGTLRRAGGDEQLFCRVSAIFSLASWVPAYSRAGAGAPGETSQRLPARLRRAVSSADKGSHATFCQLYVDQGCARASRHTC